MAGGSPHTPKHTHAPPLAPQTGRDPLAARWHGRMDCRRAYAFGLAHRLPSPAVARSVQDLGPGVCWGVSDPPVPSEVRREEVRPLQGCSPRRPCGRILRPPEQPSWGRCPPADLTHGPRGQARGRPQSRQPQWTSHLFASRSGKHGVMPGITSSVSNFCEELIQKLGYFNHH